MISQKEKPLGFFSRKFYSAQEKYTVTEELIAITEMLKYFRTMLLGQKVRVYTDYKNLTYSNANYSSDRILR